MAKLINYPFMRISYFSTNAMAVLPGLIFGFYLLFFFLGEWYFRPDFRARYLLIFWSLNGLLSIAFVLFRPIVNLQTRKNHG